MPSIRTTGRRPGAWRGPRGDWAGVAPPWLGQRVAQQRGNLDMIGRLEEARLARSQWNDRSSDYEGSDRAYVLAFRDHGLDVATLEPAEVVVRIRGLGIARHLVSALDHWGCTRHHRPQLPGQSGAPLQDLAQQADDDSWRQEIREASVRKDWLALERLAQAPEALDQMPISLYLLAVSLEKLWPAARLWSSCCGAGALP